MVSYFSHCKSIMTRFQRTFLDLMNKNDGLDVDLPIGCVEEEDHLDRGHFFYRFYKRSFRNCVAMDTWVEQLTGKSGGAMVRANGGAYEQPVPGAKIDYVCTGSK